MELANPTWLLLLLLLAVPVVLVERRSLRSLTRIRRIATLTLRLLVLTALVLALADPRLVQNVDRVTVAFLIDASASLSPATREQALNWVRGALTESRVDDRAAIVVFGAEPLVEQSPSLVGDLPPITSQPASDDTDLAGALRLALGLLPTDAGRKVVLLTDGHETKGNAAAEARLFAAAGVPIDIVPLEAGGEAEALVRAVDGPSIVREGETFRVRVTVESSDEKRGRLHLLVDGRVMHTESITLHQGTNTFLLPHDPLPPGFHSLKVQLNADGDSLAENNEGISYLTVEGRGRLLIVEGEPGEARYLAEALRAGGLVVDVGAPNAMPTDLSSYRSFDGIVLVNVPATRLTTGQLAGLRNAVQRLGTGLVVVGGEHSFGPGGYGRTPLADALPVRMERRGLRAQSQAALLLVIDSSGSMGSTAGGVTKMAIAREAALQALDLLSDLDTAGVLAFEDTPSWVLPLGPLQDRDGVRAAVSRLQPGGGTAIYPALLEAERAMAGVDAKVRHIVLLTDGLSPSGDYVGLTDRLRQQNVTLSTIAVGLDADHALLQTLAAGGNGRYYDGSDPFDLPQLLVKETLEVARVAIVEEDFRPVVVGTSPVLEGMRRDDLPLLRGYVATTPKPTAQVSLASPYLDPLLAEWQYGLGRVVVWTSDAKNRWATNWLEWAEAVPFWSRLVKQALPNPQSQSFQTQVTVENGVARVVVDAVGDDRSRQNFLPLRLEVIGPDGQETATGLRQVAPGQYSAEVPAAAAGGYLVRVSQTDASGQTVASQTSGFGVGYSSEYRKAGQNRQLLEEIARISGGRMLEEPSSSMWRDVRARSGQPVWQWLVVFAALLFLADVAVRRVRVSLSVARATVWAMRNRWAGIARLPQWNRTTSPTIGRPVPAAVALALKRSAQASRSGSTGTFQRMPAARPRATQPTTRPPTSRPVAPSNARPVPRPMGNQGLGTRLLEAKQRASRR